MDIRGVGINCPYWANHIENGVVTIRGFQEGKGEAVVIRKEILRLADEYKKEEPEKNLDRENITYLTRQNRVGIDCSGLVFHVMEAVIEKKDLELMFPLGIRKTNADMLTHNSFSQKIDTVKEVAVGDLIRFSSGHHVVIITHIEKEIVKYIHSSSHTEIIGVHTGEIIINNPNEKIENQIWKEKTSRLENWKDKYLHSEDGDGIYRNKILHHVLNKL